MLGSIILSPLNGLAFICREIAKAVEKSLEVEKEQLMAELRALHQRVEREEMDERAFAEKESALLDRLDEINAQIRR